MALETELVAPVQPKIWLHPNLTELHRRKVAMLHEALESDDARVEAPEIIRGLIERVAIGEAQGRFGIELIGEIANMVALANAQPKQ